MTSVALFEDTLDISEAFTRKLDFLLTWSVTPLQYGDHRPYAAACLLQLWRNKAEERAIRRDAPSPDDQIQSLLFHWLNKSEVAGESANLPAVALLFGQLVKYGLFSFGMYMQHLVARGEEGLSYTEPDVKCTSLFYQRREADTYVRARCLDTVNSSGGSLFTSQALL